MKSVSPKIKYLQAIYYPVADYIICNMDNEIYKFSIIETIDFLTSQVGLENANKIVEYITEFSGECRHFEISDDIITVKGLWKHATTGKIHKSNYDTIIWQK